jgi:ABC-2 type transport system ATP-binding protein
MDKLLCAENVRKSYKDKVVLEGLNLTLEPGKIYGLIGRNGVGKTTLLGILTAQNTMDSGSVTYGGEPVWENRNALDELCFSRELNASSAYGQTNYKVDYFLKAAGDFYPH